MMAPCGRHRQEANFYVNVLNLHKDRDVNYTPSLLK